MRTTVAVLLAGTFALPGLARGEDKPVILHLASSGAEVSGSILDGGFDEARGIKLRRDDNGGLLELRWDQVRTEDVLAIKRLYGFESDDPPPLTVRALKVKIRGGKEIIGLDAGDQGPNKLIAKRGNVTPVPRESIESITPVIVDALEVENPPEAFERVRREQPPKSAVDWYNLALSAESLTLYEQAKDCFTATLAADPAFSKKDVIAQRMKVLDAKLKETAAAEMLRRIRTLRVHREYGAAVDLVNEFIQTWPSSLLLPEAQKEQRLLVDLHREAMLAEIRTQFFSVARELCDGKALVRDLSLGAGMTWAKDQLFDEAIEHLAKVKKMEPAAVKELFAARGKLGSATAVSYGAGTFILGAEESRRDLYKAKSKEKGGKDDEQEADDKKPDSLEEKIQKKLKEKQEQAKKRDQKRAGGQGVPQLADVPPTKDEWWTGASATERSHFLLAFFAEQSGPMQIERLTTRDCSQCAGTGTIKFYANNPEQANDQGEMVIPCSRCKTLGFDRIVHFK